MIKAETLGEQKIKNIKFPILVVLLISLIFLVIVDKKRKSQSIMDTYNLQPGKSFNSLWVMDVDGHKSDILAKQGDFILGIFILPKVCLPCNPNFYFLEKLSKAYRVRLKPFWIVPMELDAFKKYYNPSTSLYPMNIPVPLDIFLKEFNLDFKSIPQVTFLQRNRVIYCKTGDLDSQDFFAIREIIKK